MSAVGVLHSYVQAASQRSHLLHDMDVFSDDVALRLLGSDRENCASDKVKKRKHS